MTKKIILPLYAIKPFRGDDKIVRNPDAFHYGVGSVLGDGTISKRRKNMEIEHKSATLTLWKRRKALQLGLVGVNSNPSSGLMKLGGLEARLPLTYKKAKSSKVPRPKLNQGKDFFRTFSFSTRAVFHDPRWRESFYAYEPKGRKEFRKRIPDNIKELFWSDLALAIWYIDDGFYDPEVKTARISCGESTSRECDLMQECLYENFGLESSRYDINGKPHHFYIRRHTFPEFYGRIQPTISEILTAFPKAAISTGVISKLRIHL